MCNQGYAPTLYVSPAGFVRLCLILLTVAVFILLPSASAVAQFVTLTPDKMLQVDFQTNPPFSRTPDYMYLSLGTVNVLQPHTSRTSTLWDGETFMGSHTGDSFGGHTGGLSMMHTGKWKAPESLYTFDNPAVIDYSTIRDGSINGRIEFTIKTGAMVININNVRLFQAQAKGFNWGTEATPHPLITYKDIVPIPEPATLSLLFLGIMIINKKRR